MSRILSGAGSLALTAAAVAMTLAGSGVAVPPWAGHSPAGVSSPEVVVVAAALVAVTVVAVAEVRRATTDPPAPTRRDASTVVAVAVAAPLTRWLAVEAALGAVVAAALVGLVAHLVVPDHAVPAYCGSFVGMAAPAVFAAPATVAAAGVAAGVTFVAAGRAFDGVGGKLGTTAFVGCVAVAAATGSTPAPATPLARPEAVRAVAAAGLAAVATFALSVRLDHGPVVGSAVVGLVAGLVCPPLFSESVAAAAFCASFAGMASPDRIPDEATMLVAGLTAGGLFVGAAPHFAGFGGKLGTVAFAACLLTCGLRSARAAVAPVRTRVTSG